MTTSKERIENLEVVLGGLRDNLSKMEPGVTNKLHRLENTISKIVEALLSKQEPSSSHTNNCNGHQLTRCSSDMREESREHTT